MPKLIVFRCDEPGCKASVEIDAILETGINKNIPTPKDWDLSQDLSSRLDANYQEQYKVFCPTHNKNLKIQGEWREAQKQMSLAFEEDLRRNPPKGGLIIPIPERTLPSFKY